MLISRDGLRGEEQIKRIKYTAETELSSYDLIKYLKHEEFFPAVPEGSIWSIHYQGQEVGLYKPKVNYSYTVGIIDSICRDSDETIHFRYFLKGENRAEYLFRLYCGNKKDIYFSGHMEEYRGYQISEETEQNWREGLIQDKIYQHFDETENVEEAVALLKQIMVRPGMYVGRHRLDLVAIFFDGWCMHQKALWSFSHDLKQWLFLRESVCGSASLNGWNVFYQTYGITDHAIIQFREFLETNVPSSVFEYGRWDTATEHVSAIWSPSLHPEGPISGLTPFMDFIYEDTITEEEAYAEVIRQVKRVQGGKYKRIKVYVNSGRLVEQVRFFFDAGLGWVDGVSLNTTPDYYEKMVVLHGYIKLMNESRDKTFLLTIDWNEDGIQVRREEYQAPEFHFSYEIPPQEEFLIGVQFAGWKSREDILI